MLDWVLKFLDLFFRLEFRLLLSVSCVTSVVSVDALTDYEFFNHCSQHLDQMRLIIKLLGSKKMMKERLRASTVIWHD